MISVLLLPFRKRLEQQQKMLEEDRKRRQFEEQKQKLRLLSSVKPKVSLSLHCLFILRNIIFLACPRLISLTLRALYTLLFCTQTGEKSRDDALEAIKGNLDGFSRDAKMHPTPSSQTKKPGNFTSMVLDVIPQYFLFCISISRAAPCSSVEMPPSVKNHCIGCRALWWLPSWQPHEPKLGFSVSV